MVMAEETCEMEEAAAILGIGTESLRRRVGRGEVPAWRGHGKVLRNTWLFNRKRIMALKTADTTLQPGGTAILSPRSRPRFYGD